MAAGKLKEVALIACMRKLIIHLNAIACDHLNAQKSAPRGLTFNTARIALAPTRQLLKNWCAHQNQMQLTATNFHFGRVTSILFDY